MSHFGRFDLDIATAVSDQLSAFLTTLKPAALSDAAARSALPLGGGVYQLYLGQVPVYVGKAARLRQRLVQHASDLDGREGLSSDTVGFVAAELSPNWAPFGAEDILLRRERLAWQNSGFGANDPGRNRDHSTIEEDHWDMKYPVRLDIACPFIEARPYTIPELLRQLKRGLPFLFRYEGAVREVFKGHTVSLEREQMSFWEILQRVLDAMPGWQATALPGYVILYHEVAEYAHARRILRG